MLIDSYTMIVPEKGTLAEYERFYHMYGSIIRNSILVWKLLDESKDKLPNIYVEMTQNMHEHEVRLPSYFTAIGITYNQGLRKNYEKSISNSDIDEIKNYFNNDIGEYIEYITNRQQFLNLYTAFEGTIRSYLQNTFSIAECKQESLISTLLEKEPLLLSNFEQNCNFKFSGEQFRKIWQYYTAIRNLYSHADGYIGKRFLDTINGVKKILIDFLKADNSMDIQMSLFLKNNDDLFQFSDCKAENRGNLFTISEYNLRFFRNVILHVWETLYTNKVSTNNINAKIVFVQNRYKFRFAEGMKEHDLLQDKEQNITQNNPCFNISGYLCPQCEALGIFLYKAKFNPNIDVSELILETKNENYMARNVFTCPACHSFYFPKYQENLQQNNGFNILDLNESQYVNLLEKFESKADINFGYIF